MQAKKIFKEYDGKIIVEHETKKEKTILKIDYDIKLPSYLPLQKRHKNYLEQRNFNPIQLQQDWNLTSTNHIGEYKFRIIAPIYFQEHIVSYQGRDVTGKSLLKYKACPQTEELIHHKHVLYGAEKAIQDRIIVTEGITDVWRMGFGSVATFGVKYTKQQFKRICSYKTIFILFDHDRLPSGENPGKEASERLWCELTLLGKDAHEIILDKGDPADLSDKEAKQLKKDLLKEIY